jgi:sortase A
MRHIGLVFLLFMALAISGCSQPAAAQEADAASISGEIVTAGVRPNAPAMSPVLHKVVGGRQLPDRLAIPAIHVDTPVVELGWKTNTTASGSIFSEWDVAEYAAGWHKNSAVPGEPDNVVMSGHNNILGSVFRELDQLKRGDVIYVYAGGNKYAYDVNEVLILPEKYATAKQRQSNVRFIQPTGTERLTLVSCWPRDDNTHRIVVIANPAPLASQ